MEYSDGFGRLLQTRSQAEDTLFGDAVFGGSVLSADQSAPDVPVEGRTRGPTDPVNVVVSGWQVYDNKGRVVERYEPFFAQGWDYLPPTDAQLGQKAALFYDARGQLVRTLSPDGSEQLVVFGVLSDLADPSSYTPTAWEAYTYDANDNAGRTHGTAASGFRRPLEHTHEHQRRCPGTDHQRGRAQRRRPAADWHTTRSAYDIQGNLVAITDALGRVASRYAFDLVKRRWRVDSIDAGRRDIVPDVLGNPVEGRDSKGALTLQAYDRLHRPAGCGRATTRPGR